MRIFTPDYDFCQMRLFSMSYVIFYAVFCFKFLISFLYRLRDTIDDFNWHSILGIVMAIYLISYELLEPHAPHHDRALVAELEQYGGQRLQRCLWLIKSDSSSSSLCRDLEKFLTDQDRLWVCAVSSDYEFFHAASGTNGWLERNMFSTRSRFLTYFNHFFHSNAQPAE